MMTMERANAIATIIKENTRLEAIAQEVRKGDFIEVGITVGEPETNVRPNIYPSQFEDLPDEEIADKVVEIYENNKATFTFNVDDYTDFNRAKNNIIVCVRPATENPDDVKRPYLDMEKYIRYIVNDGASIVVKKQHAELWNVTEDVIFEVAEKNGEYVVDGMDDVLKEMMPDIDDEVDEFFEEKQGLKPMYIITNKNKRYGASAITDNLLLKKLAKRTGSKFYIIPSSIHELIMLPEILIEDVDKTDYEENVKEMIRSVNDFNVAPYEILSYSLYYFNGNEVEIVA